MPVDNQYIDLETGLGRVRGNIKIYSKMLGLFLVSEEFSQLRESATAGDIEKSAELSHAIKGMTGNLALSSLFDVSTTLGDQLREGVLDKATLNEFFVVYEATRTAAKKTMTALAED